MRQDELTVAERAFIDTLPGPPALARVRTTNIWIVEWLLPEERHTGRELHDWMEKKRPGWAIYCPCRTKADVLASIKRAQGCAQSGMVPVLHLETHGGTAGLASSNADGAELLTWEELTDPLQELNLATRCNLLVVVAACVGFAAVQAFRRGPRAPAVALVGPDANVLPGKLLAGAKEFYRWWKDSPTLTEIAESASREMGEVHFEPEPFATLCFEAMIEALVKGVRPAHRQKRVEKLRQRLLAETELNSEQIESRLAQLPPAWDWWQQMWDQMFMMDIWPENKERFGVDVKDIIERIEGFAANTR
jgi:hypothetical protein